MKVKSEKLYQQVASAITAAIRQGRYPPGSRLPGERELAEDFSVSRPTIREAMIALDIHGLVEARHGSGLYVTDAAGDHDDTAELDVGAFELIEARILFEGEAAAVAATVISDTALERLDQVLAAMAAHDPATPEALRLDRHFHMQIAEATNNSVIASVIDLLWKIRERSPLCIHMFTQARREGVHPRVDEHGLIVDALRERNPARAREMMHIHLRRVIDDLLAATEVEVMQRARSEIDARRDEIVRRLGVRA